VRDVSCLTDVCQEQTRIGEAQPRHLNGPDEFLAWSALSLSYMHDDVFPYLLLKAPRSANKASTPVRSAFM